MNARTPCNSIRNILQSAISLSSGIIPPEKSPENPIAAEIPPLDPKVAIPDPYDFAYEVEMILRCNNSPLFISLSKYQQSLQEKF